jgi:hypothetical protein
MPALFNPTDISAAELQQTVNSIADSTVKSMPLLSLLTSHANYLHHCQFAMSHDGQGQHAIAFSGGRFGGSISRHEIINCRSEREVKELVANTLRDVVAETLKGLEAALVKTIYEFVPSMKLERVKALNRESMLRDHPELTFARKPYGFCLAPVPFNIYDNCFPCFLHTQDVGTVLFAPPSSPFFCAFHERMLWPTIDKDIVTNSTLIGINCYVAARPNNVNQWLALVNEEWVIKQAERILDRAAAMV